MSLETSSGDSSMISSIWTSFPFPAFLFLMHVAKMLLIALMIMPSSLDWVFFLLMSSSNCYSILIFWEEMTSRFCCKVCIFVYISYKSFWRSEILSCSSLLVSSTSLSILPFYSKSLWFSCRRLLNLFFRDSISSNSLLSSTLSSTTSSRNFVKILCQFKLCFFSCNSYSFFASSAFKSSICLSFDAISFLSRSAQFFSCSCFQALSVISYIFDLMYLICFCCFSSKSFFSSSICWAFSKISSS